MLSLYFKLNDAICGMVDNNLMSDCSPIIRAMSHQMKGLYRRMPKKDRQVVDNYWAEELSKVPFL